MGGSLTNLLRGEGSNFVYEIETKISATKQGTLSIIEYDKYEKKLRLELDYYQDIKIKCSEDAIMLQKFVKMERIF